MGNPEFYHKKVGHKTGTKSKHQEMGITHVALVSHDHYLESMEQMLFP